MGAFLFSIVRRLDPYGAHPAQGNLAPHLGRLLKRALAGGMSEDLRRYAPATARNREPILAVLKNVLPARGLVLEVASGTGEHAVHFAPHFPGLLWQPTDAAPDALPSIDAWRAHSAAPNILPPVRLDLLADPAPVPQAEALVCINMVHISPWPATAALMRLAADLLPADGPLYLYGPYKRDGAHTAPSNAAFDADLKSRNPAWGVRDLESVAACADAAGLTLADVIPMPANNVSVVFRRRPT